MRDKIIALAVLVVLGPVAVLLAAIAVWHMVGFVPVPDGWVLVKHAAMGIAAAIAATVSITAVIAAGYEIWED